MKHLLLLLLGCIPMFSTAQTLTEAQKQDALRCATEFCNLLVRFSNGERTLDTQINALCSGADCSAYDDIKTNKEITLRNYLMAIQQKYPNKLSMEILSPNLSNCKIYIEPVLSVGVEWGNTGNSDMSTSETVSLSLESINNTYVVFDIVQKYPSLNRTMDKKLIYDVKSKKITAFISNNGAFINFLNGVLAFANKDFKAAVICFDKGAQNERSSLKKKCYGLAMISSVYQQDYKRAIYYAEQLGDPLYIAMFKLLMYMENEQFDEIGPYVTQLESLVETRDNLDILMKRNLYLTLANCYVNPLYSNQNMNKGLVYMKKAEALGDIKVGYTIFVYYTLLGDDFVDPDVALDYLQKSAESGYPPAFYQWGRMVEYGMKDTAEALRWYEKAAQVGNHIGMASAGKLLIEKGEKAKGIEWLKKSLEGRILEAQLEDCKLTTGGLAPWPKTRADVEALLNKHNTSSYLPPSNQSTYTPSTNAVSSNNVSTSNSSGNSYNSSNSYSYRRRHKFNEAKVENFGSLSAGYVQKQWTYDFGGVKEKYDVFGEDKYTNGIQFGIRTDPQFGYGFGINTGLFYEYFFDKSEELYEDGIEYYYKSEEHCLYLPVHLKYSLNFSKWFQLAFYGGVGLDYGLSGKIYLRSDGETLDSQSLYDDDLDMKRFNASLEYGAAIRINRVQLNFTTSQGLIDMSGNDEYKVKQNKLMTISASVYF